MRQRRRHGEAQIVPLPVLDGNQKPDARKWEQRARTSKIDWKWQRGIILRVQKWESEKHKSWSLPAEGFRNHVTIDGSLLGISGKWSACGWSVVQLDHDEEKGPMHGMYGTLDAELEVQRRIMC